MNKQQGCQETFLNHLVEHAVLSSIFLVNGVRLHGVIVEHDRFCLLIAYEGQLQLVYKGAISTISPNTPISLYDGDSEVLTETIETQI